HQMLDGLKALSRLTTHTLGGRIGCNELGIRRFQSLEFAVESVVFSVAKGRMVLDVVLILMQMNHLTQFWQAMFDRSEIFHRVSLESIYEGLCLFGGDSAGVADHVHRNLVCPLPLQRPEFRLARKTILAYERKEWHSIDASGLGKH